jgi:NAD(P)-dependent dehydrogenase (short-subunit alcohol dehydrogenase family)|tara:strand:+ start:74 stop:787 length:714 start_codon:yes stop_codon:yes gene_type:complete
MENIKYRAVVTGATRGIGYAIAERLLKDGLEVIITGTKKNGKHPAGSSYYQVDFLDEDSTNKFINFLKKQQINILVNNAGINKISEFSSIDIEDFDRILRINLRAPFQICQAVIPYMEKIKWGRIVNLTSVFGNISKEYRAAYSSSKFGLDGMTVALAAEVSEKGILANSVGPGVIDTDMTREVLGDSGINKLKGQIPMKRLGQVSEIASLVSWLVSNENTYMTGQNLMIDGGFTRV